MVRRFKLRLRWWRYHMGRSLTLYVGLRSFTIRFERTRLWRPVS